MEKEILKQIFNEFLKDIYTLGDEDYQKRAWVDGTPGELCDMEEWIGDFLYSGEEIIRDLRDFEVSSSQEKLLTDLYYQVEKLDEDIESGNGYLGEESRITELSKWKEIVILAQKVMNAFGNPFRISEHLMYKIDRFTNKKMQKEDWLKDEKPSEYIKGHSDSKVDIDYVTKWTKHFANSQEKYNYTDEQVEILNKLHEKLKAFPYDKSNLLEFIDSDEWKEIGELSKQALELFKDVPAW